MEHWPNEIEPKERQVTTAYFVISCIRRKEGNVLFNDALNTFYLWLYGVKHMVKDHSDSEKGNPLPPHRLLIPISSEGSFICTIPQTGQHTTAFVTPVVEHWLEREIALWDHAMKDRSDDPSHHERTLLPRSYISLPGCMGVSTCTRLPISSEPRLARARERPGGVGAHGVRAAIMRAVRTLVHIWIKEREICFI